METKVFKIYFSDLNSDAQKRLLETVEASDPKEYNWDMDILPLATVFFDRDPELPPDDMTTAEVAISHMVDPTEFMDGNIFSCQIVFWDAEEKQEDETSFDIDCSKEGWRDELLELWNDFREENGLPEDCVTDAWATVAEDGVTYVDARMLRKRSDEE